MDQDTRWLNKYEEVMTFIETNHRNPSRYDDEERGMYCNWLKHQRKLYNSGEMKEERREMFEKLFIQYGRGRGKATFQKTTPHDGGSQ